MADEEMIERCVKAHYDSYMDDLNGGEFDKQHDDAKKRLTNAMLATFKAMREPTDKMIISGSESNPTQWNDGTDDNFASDVARNVWQSMIDAVINE